MAALTEAFGILAGWRGIRWVTLFVVACSASLVMPVAAVSENATLPGNYGEAMAWYERQAVAGNVEAQYYLARQYEQGVRDPSDPSEYVDRPDIRMRMAADWYRAAAEQDHLKAQERLATLYYTGQGVERDAAEAARWFARAGAQGSGPALYNLALMTGQGDGVERDDARAAALYEQAAEAGVVDATLALIAAHARGINGKVDYQRAFMWQDVALRAGLIIDTALSTYFIQRLTPEEVRAAWDEASQRYEKIRQKIKRDDAFDSVATPAPVSDPEAASDNAGSEP